MAKQKHRSSDSQHGKDRQSQANEQRLKAALQQLKAANQQLAVSEQQLRAANQQLKADEEELRRLNHDLADRVKELNCLYGLSRLVEQPDMTLEQIFQGLAELIPPAWEYPDITCAQVLFEDRRFKTANFRKTKWIQSADIKVFGKNTGAIEVCYRRKMPELDEGAFLAEERDLVDALAERLGRVAELRQTEAQASIAYDSLNSSVNGVVITDVERKIRYVNPAFLRMFEYEDEKEVIAKSPAELFASEQIRSLADIDLVIEVHPGNG